jgi:hypothetical protein
LTFAVLQGTVEVCRDEEIVTRDHVFVDKGHKDVGEGRQQQEAPGR